MCNYFIYIICLFQIDSKNLVIVLGKKKKTKERKRKVWVKADKACLPASTMLRGKKNIHGLELPMLTLCMPYPVCLCLPFHYYSVSVRKSDWSISYFSLTVLIRTEKPSSFSWVWHESFVMPLHWPSMSHCNKCGMYNLPEGDSFWEKTVSCTLLLISRVCFPPFHP